MRAYYFVAAILACVNMVVFTSRDDSKKKVYNYLKILFIIFCVANLGYVALGVSSSLSEAVLAKKITYLGGCFIPPTMAYCLCSICNINLKRWIEWLGYLFSAVVYGMVLSAGFSDLYYKDMKLGKVYDATALVTVHGFGHAFFYVILYGYLIVDILIIVMALLKRQVAMKKLYLLIAMQSISSIAFILGRLINPAFEVMPFIYVVDGFIFIKIQEQLSKYNLDDSFFNAIQQNNTSGYIVFDEKFNFIGCNNIAKACIPGLASCKVDAYIEYDNDASFLNQWLWHYRDDKKTQDAPILQHETRFYEAEIKKLNRSKKLVGYIIELQDCTDRKRYLDLLSNYNEKLKQQVEEQTQHIRLIQRKTVLGMASMVEDRDNNTGGHIKRTSDVIEILINTIRDNRLIKVSEEFCQDIIKAAPMHDLGKIAIEDKILQKPGRFTDEEFEVMKTHAEKSARIVESILRGVEEEHFVNIAVNVARYHHEKWNGQGYPMHLSGENIPLEARIMAIADVYDALVSKRCYKEAMSYEKAADIMLESMGSHFDPAMEKVFLLSREKLEKYYSEN